MKAKAKKDAKAAAAAGTLRRDAKDLALTQSPAVAEVVNVENAGTTTTIAGSAVYAIPLGDFRELHQQLDIVHQVCLASILAFSTGVGIVVSPRPTRVSEKPNSLKSFSSFCDVRVPSRLGLSVMTLLPLYCSAS
jgi:hypothetical protein